MKRSFGKNPSQIHLNLWDGNRVPVSGSALIEVQAKEGKKKRNSNLKQKQIDPKERELFKETHAYAQILAYAAKKELTSNKVTFMVTSVLDQATILPSEFEASRPVKNIQLADFFIWKDSKEGSDYWSEVSLTLGAPKHETI
jgi:hypothetical protein